MLPFAFSYSQRIRNISSLDIFLLSLDVESTLYFISREISFGYFISLHLKLWILIKLKSKQRARLVGKYLQKIGLPVIDIDNLFFFFFFSCSDCMNRYSCSFATKRSLFLPIILRGVINLLRYVLRVIFLQKMQIVCYQIWQEIIRPEPI